MLKKFDGLQVKKSIVHEHMVNECCLSFKLVHPVTEKHNAIETKEKRLKWATAWNNIEKARDFYNSVFIDESGFNWSMAPHAGWSWKGQPIWKPMPWSSPNITNIGAILIMGAHSLSSHILMITKEKPLPKKAVDVPGGTKCIHFLSFLDQSWWTSWTNPIWRAAT